MALTVSTITLRGRVNSRVVRLFADGAEIVLAADKSFAHAVTLAVPPGSGVPSDHDRLVKLTTIDAQGLSETRIVRIEREAVPHVAAAAV
jgi:hypothetical protein